MSPKARTRQQQTLQGNAHGDRPGVHRPGSQAVRLDRQQLQELQLVVMTLPTAGWTLPPGVAPDTAVHVYDTELE